MTQHKRIGGMCTYPARLRTLARVLQSICPQLDVLYLYLNEYDEIPDKIADIPNLVPILGSRERGNLSAAGKMAFLTREESGFAFILDDDIFYPPDYVESTMNLYHQLGGGVGLCVHGSVIPDSASWYYERSVIYDSNTELKQIAAVNLIGSGTFSYSMSDISLNFEDFIDPVQVDLEISLSFLRKGLPLIASPRTEKWIKFFPYEGMTRALMRTLTHHTLAMRNCDELSHAHLIQIWRDHMRKNPDCECPLEIKEALEPQLRNQTWVRPVGWQATSLSLKKALDFSSQWCN